MNIIIAQLSIPDGIVVEHCLVVVVDVAGIASFDWDFEWTSSYYNDWN